MAIAEQCRRVAVLLALTSVATSCLAPPPAPPHVPVTVNTAPPERPQSPPSVAPGFPELGGDGPGSLRSASPFDAIDPNITATGASTWQIRYMSTSAVGDLPVEVTGLVIVPGGEAPYEGWRIIAYNHPNTGVTADCGPSAYEDLANQWGPVATLLQYGFAVVMTDYEGLGGPGRHAFLNSAALGRNVIDGVRAARHLRPDIGRRWATYGNALGGLAAWAANEQASSYGTDVELVGAVARMPWANLSGLPARARLGALTPDQLAIYTQAVMSLQATTQPGLDVRRFLSGPTYDNRDRLLRCKGAPAPEGVINLPGTDPADVKPVDLDAELELTRLINDTAVPQQRTAAPMLVIYASADSVVDQISVEQAILQSCAMGDTIEWNQRPGTREDGLDVTTMVLWIRARFDNKEPVNLCPAVPERP